MTTGKDTQGLLGGILLMAIGAFAAWYALGHYPTGSFGNMGPGFLPIVLGGVLALLGLIIAIPAWFRPGDAICGDWGSACFVVASVVVFGLLVTRLGVVPASLVATLLSLVPDRRLGWPTKFKVAIVISAITYLIFIQGLGMHLPAWPWSG